MKNNAENVRRIHGMPKTELEADNLSDEITNTMDTIDCKGLGNGATAGRVKGVFTKVQDKHILGFLGRFPNTALIAPENIAKVVVLANHPDRARDKAFKKTVDKAIKDEVRKRDEAERETRKKKNQEVVVYANHGK